MEKNYRNDKLHGYYKKKEIFGDVTEGNYKNGRKEGEWKQFRDGKLDIEETYKRASKMLADAITSNQRPTVLWVPIPVLVSGEMSSTFVEPCKSIYKNLELLDQRKDIIDCNLMV